jgi:hypothetical protein
MNMRACTKCGAVRTEDEFYSCKNICRLCRKQYNKEYRAKNREIHNARNREYISKNRQAFRDMVNRSHRKLREDVIKAYGGMCSCCGESRYAFLALDHIHGGGTQHRKIIKSRNLYTQLRRDGYPKGEYQVLCHNCNMAKGFYGSCPHVENQLVDAGTNLLTNRN